MDACLRRLKWRTLVRLGAVLVAVWIVVWLFLLYRIVSDRSEGRSGDGGAGGAADALSKSQQSRSPYAARLAPETISFVAQKQCEAFEGMDAWVDEARPLFQEEAELMCDRKVPIRKRMPVFLTSLRKLYSPSERETSLASAKASPDWKTVTVDCAEPGFDETVCDAARVRLNALGITLNTHLPKPRQERDTVPVWLRAYKRTSPLDRTLRALCDVNDINEAIVIVSFDGTEALPQLIDVVANVTCARVRLLFHPFTSTRALLYPDAAPEEAQHERINSHFTFGLASLFWCTRVSYVLTLEDDTLPLPDFFNMHRRALRGPDGLLFTVPHVFSINSYSRGPCHDCEYLEDKLKGVGECTMGDTHTFTWKTKHWESWGAGITERAFQAYYTMPYDALMMLNMDADVDVNLVPCSTRIRRIPNVGVNGESHKWWDWDVDYPTEHNGKTSIVLPCGNESAPQA